MPLTLPFSYAQIPVTGTRVISRQGIRPHRHAMHNGVDLAGREGVAILPVGPGTVKKVCLWVPGETCCNGFGNDVLVDHGSDLLSFYAHMSRVDVTEGQDVDYNTVLGAVGHTFNDRHNPLCPQLSMVAHLHLELRHEDETRYDVLSVLAAGGIGLDPSANLVRVTPFDYAEPALIAAKADIPEVIVGSPALRYGRWYTLGVPVTVAGGIVGLVTLGVYLSRRNASTAGRHTGSQPLRTKVRGLQVDDA